MDGDISPLLLAISEELDRNNLQSLKFLCVGHISFKEYESIREAKDLFRCLRDKGLLEAEDVSLLKELLFRIKRMDLLKQKMGTSKEEMETVLQDRAIISPYRLLLVSITDSLTIAQVGKIKFLLDEKLQRNKMENSTMFEILIEMEKSGYLSEGDLEELKRVLKNLNRNDLLKRIERFEVQTKDLPQQESCAGKPLPRHQVCQREEQPVQVAKLGETYRMEDVPHGYCLIINNYDFSRSEHKLKKKFREGTLEDAASLTKTFRSLCFTVEECRDLTAGDIRQVLRAYRAKDHTGKDCFVCCILSHGDKGTVYGTDGMQVPIKEMTAYFNGQKCPKLAGKPKVFFIQACQGNDSQHSCFVDSDSISDVDFESDASPLVSIPIGADFLIGMATVEDCKSYRHIQKGSVYIQSLCQKLEALCPQNIDILSILTEVNKDVAPQVLEGKKQMPEIRTTLRKKLVFPVPSAEGDEME